MKRVYHTFRINDTEQIKKQMLSWANRFSICCFLDNHHYQSPYHTYECVLGVGVIDAFEPREDFFNSLSSFVSLSQDWIFGHFNYDIKNKIEEGLVSAHDDKTAFPDCFLYVPEVVITLRDNELIIGVVAESADDIFQQIIQETFKPVDSNPISITAKVSKEKYIEAVNRLIYHIHIGDCYVINYCQEFFANASIDPLSIYQKLTAISPNPFSAYYRLIDKYLLCASLERFINKRGNKIISQPIKGTSARDHANCLNDEKNKHQLFNSEKERSENVMVVDLVRNDLSKVCKTGTVTVDELFGLYSFPTVHQMISTVSGVLDEKKDFADIIKALFPMGSMTGAPKRKVMELIEQYEYSKRGIYSGSVGYITPEKNADFNVVIRSLVYNEAASYLSYHVGSAITAYCDAEKEYEECMLKGKSLMEAIFGHIHDQ